MIQEKIINLSKMLGFNLIGFTRLKYYKELERILIKQEELGGKTSFQIGSIDDKTFKSDKYKDFKSAIVFGLVYNKSIIDEKNINNDEVYLSSYCYGEDYHKVISKKLEVIKEFLNDNGCISEIFVDNNCLDERYLACEAGLGFYGLNSLLINEEYGSYFFIGIILTNAIFEYNERKNKKCLECRKCIEACPTGAINEKGILNGNKCLSYLTQKKNLNEEEKSKFNKCIFGCDICSKVCPHNENIKYANNFEFSGIELIKIEEFKKLTEEEFDKKYGKNACSWRGKKTLDRNIEIIEEKIAKKK
jgi:epoxyqueuosine reductase